MKSLEIFVELLDHMGSDLTVVNAARVSMSKWHYAWQANDQSLLNYLAEHNHWSPFAHAVVQVRVTAPIYIARQLAKSQVGFAWNEVSRRYVDDEPTFYMASPRKRAENVKQGSMDELVENWDECLDSFDNAVQAAIDSYDFMLKSGVAPEVARSVLPQAMNTQWIWTGSLYAFWRVVMLRTDTHAQKESQIVGHQIKDILKKLFPNSMKALEARKEVQ